MPSTSDIMQGLCLFISGAVMGKKVYNAVTKDPDTIINSYEIPNLNYSQEFIEAKSNKMY